MARAGKRNIPTLTAQQATIDLLKQPLLEINYFIEVIEDYLLQQGIF